MIKSILRLLAASTSFVALLLITNSAIAVTSVDLARVEPAHLNLNVVSPTLQSIGNSNILQEHLGCSCAVCTRGLERTNIRI